ncbi:MAG: hypothetical protein MI746_15095 [Pseudomonadales bacterium]|nr:hypothetical protein [Pseudomonadales bacterium]
MSKAIASYLLSDFANNYGYDVGYLENMADVSPGAFYRYLLCTPLSRYRSKAPLQPYMLAKMVATKHFDCGPCLNLVINMAREVKLDDKTIHAALTEDVSALSDEEALAVRYANAVINQDAVALKDSEMQIVDQWGEKALTDFAIGVAFAAFYPILRRGLGHAHSCEPVMKELERLVSHEPALSAGEPA